MCDKTFEPKTFEPKTFEPKTFESKTFEPKTVKPKRFILSIDGGGVRGTIAARILSHLEKTMKKKNSIHNLFDMFIGSSTGALIIGGITHCNLSAQFISESLYTKETCDKIMPKSIIDKIMGLIQTKPLYNGIGKKTILTHLAGDIKFMDTKKKVMIPVYDITQDKPIIFKSWKYTQVPLVNILDASSAAPGYFPSVEYVPHYWGIDSGVIAYNPTLCAYVEMLKLHDVQDDIRILSIGTGYGYKKSLRSDTETWGGLTWGVKGDLLNLLMDVPMEQEEHLLKTLVKMNGHKYIRINKQLHNASMDDTSQENIDLLKSIGDKLWNEYKEQIIDLLFHE